MKLFQFKTARGIRRFQLAFVSGGLLVLFSRPIWDFIGHPIYDLFTGAEEKRLDTRMRVTMKSKDTVSQTVNKTNTEQSDKSS